MYGDTALLLIQDSRRSQQTSHLPKYQTSLVRHVSLETRQLGAAITAAASQAGSISLSQDKALVCSLTVQHLAAKRNKRCLLAYHMQRCERLGEMWWEAGGALAFLLNPGTSAGGDVLSTSSELSTDPKDLRSALSPQETDFLRGYSDLHLEYKSQFLDVLDLAASVNNPPTELYVDVRVVKDCGTVYTEMGAIEFTRGQRYLVRRGDVERLIVQGFLEEV